MLIGHLFIFFGDVSIQIICLFLIRLFVIVLLSRLCIFLDVRSLSEICYGNIFSLSVHKLIILTKSNLSVFSLKFCAFKPLPNSKRQRFFPIVSSRHFIVFGFAFRFVICSSYFCIWCETRVMFDMATFHLFLVLCHHVYVDTACSVLFHVRQDGSVTFLLTLPPCPTAKI